MAVGRSPLVVLFTAAVVALSMVNAYDSTILALTKSKLPGTIACPGDFDLVVILDHSTSVSIETSASFIEFIKKLIHLFNIREDGNHFGLVLYNENPEIIMKLDQNNTVEEIKDYLMTSLPGRDIWRNLQRALRETRRQILPADMGNRPDAKDVCVLLTTEGRAFVKNNKQYPKIKDDCKYFIHLRKGDYNDLEKVQDAVCPAITAEEAKNRTIDLCKELHQCNTTCNDSVGISCPEKYSAVGKTCYLLQLRRETYNDSLTACQEKDGYLARLDTEEEVLTFNDYIVHLGDDLFFWIGLRDETGDNMDWQWISDGSSLTFDNWYNGTPPIPGFGPQPDNEDDPCVVAVFIHGATGSWFDLSCINPSFSVCETDPN